MNRCIKRVEQSGPFRAQPLQKRGNYSFSGEKLLPFRNHVNGQRFIRTERAFGKIAEPDHGHILEFDITLLFKERI